MTTLRPNDLKVLLRPSLATRSASTTLRILFMLDMVKQTDLR
eukprot:CAMPEP_0171535450 /NCGR_PEP_ID=MMETSP0959-20130129/17106_1 /TAXON_ID=87120 /ORGANISM="Aurantiochytrium limacinum, Strain ATCCMYA-1381" /LENGTH=41 /DNA_ID= /DNA_START= /DNA_END= /DNA_ORIENTATION=